MKHTIHLMVDNGTYVLHARICTTYIVSMAITKGRRAAAVDCSAIGKWQAFFSRQPSRAHHRDALMSMIGIPPISFASTPSTNHSRCDSQRKALESLDRKGALTKRSSTHKTCLSQYQTRRVTSDTCQDQRVDQNARAGAAGSCGDALLGGKKKWRSSFRDVHSSR